MREGEREGLCGYMVGNRYGGMCTRMIGGDTNE